MSLSELKKEVEARNWPHTKEAFHTLYVRGFDKNPEAVQKTEEETEQRKEDLKTLSNENGDLEIVQWNNGVPDFENSKKYFDIAQQNREKIRIYRRASSGIFTLLPRA